MRGRPPLDKDSWRWRFLPRRTWNLCALFLALLAMTSGTPSVARLIDCLDGESIESPDASEGESESPVEDSSGDGDAVGVVTCRTRSARHPQCLLQFAHSEDAATAIQGGVPSRGYGRFVGGCGCFRLRC